MSVMLDGKLVFVLNLIGFNWPAADEDKVKECARHWREYAAELEHTIADTNRILAQVRAENSGESIDALEKHWLEVGGHLRQAHDAARVVAQGLDEFALAVEALKVAMAIQLGILATELAVTTGGAILTFGLAELAAPAEVVGTQIIVRKLTGIATHKVEQLVVKRFAKAVTEHFLSIKNGLKTLRLSRITLQTFGRGLARGGGKDLKQAPVRVFWSGPGTRAAAEKYAKTHGGVTLGMTPAGQAVERAAKGLPWFTHQRPMWEAASKKFAETASGKVHMFRAPSGVRPDSIWTTVESKALESNKQVTRIVYHVVRE